MTYLLLIIIMFSKQVSNICNDTSEKIGKLPLAQELFPYAELLWSREFKGRMLDFKIANGSGHVAIATVDDDTKGGTVYYFTSYGELLWEKNNLVSTDLKTIYDCGIKIADDGSKIMVHWYGDYESAQIQIYDTKGELFFDYPRGAEMIIVPQFLSPNGQYFFEGKWYITPTVPVKAREYLNEQVDFSEFGYFQKAEGWQFNQVSFLSDNEVCIIADRLVPERESNDIKVEFLATIEKVVSGEIDIGLKATTIRRIRYWWENPGSPLERKVEAIRVILKNELMDVAPEMQEKVKELLQKSEIPVTESGIYCCLLPTGNLKWKIDLKKQEKIVISPMEGYILIKSYNGKRELTLIDKTNGFPCWKREPPDPDFPIVFSHLINKDVVVLWEGNVRLRILDFHTGKEIISDQLEEIDDTFNKKYALICFESDILLSGVRNISGERHKAWNWTYIWKFDKEWKIKEKVEEKGLVIATDDLHVIALYQSDLEEFVRYKGPHCESFQISILEKKN